jgi:hypothetical protein
MTSCEVIVSLHIKLLQPVHVPKYEFRTGIGHILEDNLLVSEVPLFFSLSGGSVKINPTRCIYCTCAGERTVVFPNFCLQSTFIIFM